jgi:PD-(D/E)XK nuclease superfamily
MGLIQHPTNPTSEKAVGAAIEVHRHLGPGLLESSYHTCLCRELELRSITYHRQIPLPITYKGVVDKLLPIHSAQLMTFMRLQGVSSGLLINFNVAVLPHGIRRILL